MGLIKGALRRPITVLVIVAGLVFLRHKCRTQDQDRYFPES